LVKRITSLEKSMINELKTFEVKCEFCEKDYNFQAFDRFCLREQLTKVGWTIEVKVHPHLSDKCPTCSKKELEPTPEDWLRVGNGLRAMLGLSPMTKVCRCPIEEELDAYEKSVPGSRKLLIEAALAEAEHRVKLNKLYAEMSYISAWNFLAASLFK
jgi:hypothetical protein